MKMENRGETTASDSPCLHWRYPDVMTHVSKRNRVCGNVRYHTIASAGVDIISEETLAQRPTKDEFDLEHHVLEAYDASVLIDRQIQARRMLPRLGGTGAWLDIGCSFGVTLEAAREAGWRVAGIEPSAKAAAQAVEKGFDVTTGEFPDVQVDGSFDVISALDVIEHITEPQAFLEQAAAKLTDRGRIVIQVPNRSGLIATVLRAMGRSAPIGLCERMWQTKFYYPHVFYFSQRGLTRLGEAAGLRVVDAWTNPIAEPGTLNARLTAIEVRGVLKRSLYKLILSTTIAVSRLIRREELLVVVFQKS